MKAKLPHPKTSAMVRGRIKKPPRRLYIARRSNKGRLLLTRFSVQSVVDAAKAVTLRDGKYYLLDVSSRQLCGSTEVDDDWRNIASLHFRSTSSKTFRGFFVQIPSYKEHMVKYPMQSRLARLSVVSLLGVAAPAQQSSAPSEELVKAAIAQTVERVVAAWNKHDAHAFALAFTEDADFTNVQGIHARGLKPSEGCAKLPVAACLTESVISSRSRLCHEQLRTRYTQAAATAATIKMPPV